MRTYEQLRDDIIRAIPTGEELDALTDEQKQDLRKFGNTFDNFIYLATARASAGESTI